MVKFINNSPKVPFKKFKQEYDSAFTLNQRFIEAMCISSFSFKTMEVDSRYVNLKIVDNENFVFFSNYNSPKSKQFNEHNKIAISIFWETTNVQIRMKGQIKRAPKEFNNTYFSNRGVKKNALAIASNQSEKIESYSMFYKKYNEVLEKEDLLKCPDYWGGFFFNPLYIEFWNGHEDRINKRVAFVLDQDKWHEHILQP